MLVPTKGYLRDYAAIDLKLGTRLISCANPNHRGTVVGISVSHDDTSYHDVSTVWDHLPRTWKHPDYNWLETGPTKSCPVCDEPVVTPQPEYPLHSHVWYVLSKGLVVRCEITGIRYINYQPGDLERTVFYELDEPIGYDVTEDALYATKEEGIDAMLGYHEESVTAAVISDNYPKDLATVRQQCFDEIAKSQMAAYKCTLEDTYIYKHRFLFPDKPKDAWVVYRDLQEQEYIVAAAIRCPEDDKEWKVVFARDHGECYKRLKDHPGLDNMEHGFITNTYRFVGRVEAGRIAFAAGQIPNDPEGDIICSEEFWSQGGLYDWDPDKMQYVKRSQDV